MHKAKILQQLLAKFPGVAKAILEQVAESLSKTVTEETAIEGAISELDKMPISIKDYGDLLQREGDRRVTEAQKKFQADKDKDKKDDSKSDSKDDDSKPDAGLAKQLEEINKKLADIQTEKVQIALSQKLSKKIADEKIPAQLLKGRTINSEEELEAVFEDIKSDYAAMKQDMANEGFGEIPKPGEGNKGEPGKKAIEADIAAWAKANQPVAVPAK